MHSGSSFELSVVNTNENVTSPSRELAVLLNCATVDQWNGKDEADMEVPIFHSEQ